MKELIRDPYQLDISAALEASESNFQGLTSEQAKERLQTFGPNQLPEGDRISFLWIFLKQFRSSLVLILTAAAVISWFIGNKLDTWVIIAAIFVDVTIGFTQEYRAQKAILSLKHSIVYLVKVMRDCQMLTLPVEQIVPGDIVILEEGDQVPADGRIIQRNNFRTIEAPLTGESIPVFKYTTAIKEDVTIADQKNMVWRGTYVAGGYAQVLITGTGLHTELGKIAESLHSIDEGRSNFFKKTSRLAKQMTGIALISATLIFCAGYFIRGFDLNDVLLTSIAALVAAIPEGINVIFSIVLAIGAKRMAKRNAIVKEFSVTETLGSISTILTDKTGTLTQNSLTVRKVFIPGKDEITVTGEGWFPAGNFVQKDDVIVDTENTNGLKKLLEISAISNNSNVFHDDETNSYKLTGDPTEGALLVMAKKGGVHPEAYSMNKLDDLPFDSDLKLRATLINNRDHHEIMITGAPETILDRCSEVVSDDGKTSLNEEQLKNIQHQIIEWSGQALRVLALAYKKTEIAKVDVNDMNDLVFVGIVGMIDPPRKETREAVEKCKEAGIRVVMLTGDHVNTAVAIARSSGIIPEEDDKEIIALTEQQLLELDDKEFDQAITEISVFARLTPKMKMRIAGRLQEMGQLIAMTGDGVNDAPALKQADAGIAMGIAGTDTAREAADIVLADNNFATIVNAIEEGRIVFANVRQTSFFLITTNIAESAALLIAIAIGLPLPLTVTQLLWMNLVTDGITDVALATEAGHGDIMKSKPISKNENIINKEIVPILLINLVFMVALSLGSFLYFSDVSLEKARTAAFITLALTQLFNVYNLRSIHLSVLKFGLFTNNLINFAVGISVALLIVITEVPSIAGIFEFESMDLIEFIILTILSSSVFWMIEIYKIATYKQD